MVTELVTNSYKHVGTGHIVVRVLPDVREPLTVIEVWDESSALPSSRTSPTTPRAGAACC